MRHKTAVSCCCIIFLVRWSNLVIFRKLHKCVYRCKLLQNTNMCPVFPPWVESIANNLLPWNKSYGYRKREISFSEVKNSEWSAEGLWHYLEILFIISWSINQCLDRTSKGQATRRKASRLFSGLFSVCIPKKYRLSQNGWRSESTRL